MDPLRILIADDHELVRRGLRSLLDTHAQWQICGEAVDGQDAIEKARLLKPDVMILDINMPNVNGLEAVPLLKQHLPKSEVLLISQHDPSFMLPTALEAGATGYISKAALSNDLLAALEAIKEHRQPPGNSSFLFSEPRLPATVPAPTFLSGGGEMGALMRRMDWAQTPLGDVDSWSPTLRMMTRFLLANRFPLLLWWGPEFCSLYNDAYRPILGVKHPKSMGQPVSQCWHEIWHILKPLIEAPFRGGPATWMEDIPLEINRHGFLEETHFTIAYSPVPDETVPGGIGGVLATVHEISEKVVAERRVVVLRDLGARSVEPKTAEEACAIACEILRQHPKDIPFAMLYLLDGNRARLAASAGIDSAAGCPEIIDLAKGSRDDSWELSRVLLTEQLHLSGDLKSKFLVTPSGPWQEAPKSAAVIPIRSNIVHRLAGFMVAGISPLLEFDRRYQNFLELVSTQIATMISNALGYEAERKRSDALAEIDRAKTTFFSNVSHEFRTPLTLMLGPLADLLANSPDLSPALREQLEGIDRNATRLLRLVNTLLDFSRIEAGRAQAVYQPTDLAALTSELAGVFRSATERAGLQLVINCSPLKDPAYVDRDMWEKIVLNLISNAFKFTFTGEIAITLHRLQNSAELRVRDTGVGIPQEEIPRLFERFHRVQNARSRTYEGSGIGLALVHELVKFHGGSLRAESTLGKGSTFIVTLPLGKDHLPQDRIQATRPLPSTSISAASFVEEALRWLPGPGQPAPLDELPVSKDLISLPPSPVPRDANTHRPCVLVVDDNADMRQYLIRLLAERYTVQTVPDGLAALEFVRHSAPDLVLTDVMMPRLDGFGLLQQLRSDPRTNAVPIILLSARAGEEARVDGLGAGADDYLVKPFSSRELLARVQTHLELARVRAEAQDAVRARSAQLESLLDRAPLGVFLVDGEFRIRHVNPSARPTFGDIPGLIGLNFADVIRAIWPREFADETIRVFRHTLETGEPYETPQSTETRIDRGTVEHYECRVDRISLPEGGFGVVCYFREISAQVHAREALKEVHENLETRVKLRTAELERAQQDLRDLSARLMQAQDEERRRIARELHDSAGQLVAALAMNLSAIGHNARRPNARLAEAIADSRLLVQQLTQEIRTMSYLLHPPLLDEHGLNGALRWYAEGLTQRSGIAIELAFSRDIGRLPEDLELALFRIAQECLTNIHRHSGSKSASIRLTRDAAEICMEIADHGCGISNEKLRTLNTHGSGVGLRGMLERVRHFGGRLQVDSNSAGTTISVVFPIPAVAAVIPTLSSAAAGFVSA
jgi:PAS domain S-box-containing protein